MIVIQTDKNYELTELAKALTNSPDDLYYVVKKVNGKDVSFAVERSVFLQGISGSGLVIQSEGAVVGSQPNLNFVDSASVVFTVSEDAGGNRIDVTATASGVGSVLWGSITGTLADQTDLNNALGAKLEDVTGLISQGSNISIAGSGTIADPYVVSSVAGGGQVDTVIGTAGEVEVTGTAIDRVVSLPTVVKASLSKADTALQSGDNITQLTNDAGYLTSGLQSGDNVSELVNDAGYVTTSGGQVDTVVGTTDEIEVDSTDPVNPVASLAAAAKLSLSKADSALQSLPATLVTATADFTTANRLVVVDATGRRAKEVAVLYTDLRKIADFISDGFGGYIQGVTARSYNIILFAPYDGVLETLKAKLEVGTVTAALAIGGTAVTGGSINATTTLGSTTMTANNVFTKGDLIKLTFTVPSGDAEGFDFMILFKRKTI